MQTKQRISYPSLSKPLMTDDDFQQALTTPVEIPIRCGEITIQPETEKRKPKYNNRILASGIKQWESYGSIPLTTLIKNLLVLYFTGQLTGSIRELKQAVEWNISDGEPSVAIVDDFIIDLNTIPDIDEKIDDDYEF